MIPLLRWLRWRKSAGHPLLQQNKASFRKFDQSKPIESYEFVSFDTELTGLNPRRDEIVSIGAVRIRDLRIEVGDNFFAYVRATRDLPKDSTLIHKITPDQVRQAPEPSEILPEFVEYCGSSLLVGHYVSLDMTFVNKALLKHMGGIMHNPCVDSMRLAQAHKEYRRQHLHERVNPGFAYNLGALAREYELPIFQQHDALEDAFQTAYLFIFLVKQLRAAGYVTLSDFYRAGRFGPRIF